MDLVEMLFNNAMNAEGGGGGGDYKVFKVTVIPREGASFGLDVYTNNNSAYDGMFAVTGGFKSAVYIDESAVFDLVCFGDSVNYVYPANIVTATSGAIEYDEANSCYIISGDCSITGYNDD